MKNRIVLITLAVVALGVLAIAPMLLAGPGGEGRPGMRMHGGMQGGLHGFGMLGPLRHLKEELGLSDAQMEQIAAIVADLRTKNEPYRGQLRGGVKDAAQILLANPQDVAGARTLLEQQSAAERAMKENALQAISRALAVLSAEQRTELGKFLEERAGRFGHRRRGES